MVRARQWDDHSEILSSGHALGLPSRVLIQIWLLAEDQVNIPAGSARLSELQSKERTRRGDGAW